jgi:hypothetical protein
MTQDEVLAMLHKVVAENQQYTTWTVSTPHLVALVNQAIEKEREACWDIVGIALLGSDRELTKRVAAAIRARGEA